MKMLIFVSFKERMVKVQFRGAIAGLQMHFCSVAALLVGCAWMSLHVRSESMDESEKKVTL